MIAYVQYQVASKPNFAGFILIKLFCDRKSQPTKFTTSHVM
ncbi:hypothetical protein MtrunA17_Chr5g0405591 [Medicago truncatula]|uniref:Uncharacterized protein n=1 Tax=Medicago truncatula TaxID=3880 RepID=A0A396HSG5_MEDTR|nr:hypothetical protein MtrunA17_Chr5g0405591 [Medicago truncatula]